MNVVTNRPTLFAVNAHYDERGEWVGFTGAQEGMAVETKGDNLVICIGQKHTAEFVELTPSEARQLALWLLETVETRP